MSRFCRFIRGLHSAAGDWLRARLVLEQVGQIAPRIDPAGVPVRKRDVDAIVPHRIDGSDRDVVKALRKFSIDAGTAAMRAAAGEPQPGCIDCARRALTITYDQFRAAL